MRNLSFLIVCGLLLSTGCVRQAPSSPAETTSYELVPIEKFQRDMYAKIREVRDKIAKQKNVKPEKVAVKDVESDPDFKRLNLMIDNEPGIINGVLTTPVEKFPPLPELSGFRKVDFADEKNPAIGFSVANPASETGGLPTFATIKTVYGLDSGKYQFIHLKVQATPLRDPDAPKNTPIPVQVSVEKWIGPTKSKLLNDQIQQATKQNPTTRVQILGSVTAALYSNAAGDLAWVPEGDFPNPEGFRLAIDPRYYKLPPDKMNVAIKDMAHQPAPLTMVAAIKATSRGQ